MAKALSRYTNLTQRIITGLLGSAAIIAGVIYSEWIYFVLFFALCFLTIREFYGLLRREEIAAERTAGIFCSLLIFTLSFFVERGDISYRFYFLIFPLLSVIFIIKLYKKSEPKPFTNIAFTFLGILYVAVPISLLNIAAFDNHVYNFEVIVGCLFILWASDTGAYFAGTYLGKRKLFQRISPKKSWEGFFGGAALALVFTYIMASNFHSLDMLHWFGVGLIIIVGGTFGDLVESLLKRSIAIKDSGDALPGHGGFLDRFDGLLISAPFIVAFLELL